MTVQVEKQLFTVEDYYKMAEAGILRPEERFELIKGEIFKMSPIKSFHASIVDLLNELLVVAFHKKATIRVQNPLRVGTYSEPEPDFVIARKRREGYRSRHPRPEDVFLVIEVADSSLLKDRQVKIPLYAEAGIPEYWIVNLQDEQIEIYRLPEQDDYLEKSIVKSGEKAVCASIEFELEVSEIFG